MLVVACSDDEITVVRNAIMTTISNAEAFDRENIQIQSAILKTVCHKRYCSYVEKNLLFVMLAILSLYKNVLTAEFADSYGTRNAEMLMDVAGTILSVFKFSRTPLDLQNRPRNLLEELRGEKPKEVLTELKSLEDSA